MDEQELLSMVGSLEEKSTHPIRNAFLLELEQRNLHKKEVEHFQNIAGIGLSGVIDGKEIYVGNQKLFSKLKIEEKYKQEKEAWTKEGNSLVYVFINHEVVALFGVSDIVREDAKDTIQTLQKYGKETVMLTGDDKVTASVIAKELRITHVIAGVMPKEKTEMIRTWKEKNEKEAILSEKEKEKRVVEKRLDQKQAEFNRISSERKRLKRELMQEQEKLLFTLEKKKEVRSQLEEQSKQQQEVIESLNCSEEELPSMIEMYKSMKRQQRNAKEIEELEKREIDLEQAIETQTKATEAKTIRWNEIRSIQHRLREMYELESIIPPNRSPPSHSKPFIPPFLKEMQRILDSIHSDAIRGPLAFLPIRVTHSTFILPASIAIQHALTTTIIVENRETAILVADTFKREQGGVITCLILSELNQSSVKYPTIPHTRPLVEAIQCAEEYRPLIQKLFGRWLLVENDDAAIRVQRELNGWDCVTMDGIVYSAKGEVRQVEEKLEMEGKREK